MRSRKSIWAMALLVGSQGTLVAQRPTFRTATELVNLNVTVVDPRAQHVSGLSQDQFQVFEDGVLQTVCFFAPGDLPLDVFLMLDTSGSMAESLPMVKEAASRFVRALRTVDRAAVLGISNSMRVLQPLTGDFAPVEQAIAGTRASGRTPLYSSIYAKLVEMEKARHDAATTPRRQALVLLSDGHDTSSGFGFDDLMSTVRRHAVPIYTIAPRSARTIRSLRDSRFGESTHTQDFELRRIAAETGGRAFFPIELSQLGGAYGDIANELAHQYSIGYQSSNTASDGAFRRVSLRVLAPGVTWRTRAGYLADPDGRRFGDEDR